MKSQFPKTLSLAIVLLSMLAGCQVKFSPEALVGKTWTLVNYQNAGSNYEPVGIREANIRFEADKLAGNTGCNQYGGAYTLVDGQLKAEGVFTTKMACAEVMEQENLFLGLLNADPKLKMPSDNELVMTAGEVVFFFKLSTAAQDTTPEGTASQTVPTDSNAAAAVANNISARSAAPVNWRIDDQAKVVRGMFAYLADAAVFINCADNERYSVAMEADFLAVETAYLQLMGEEAGKRILLTAEGTISQRPPTEGSNKKGTIVIQKLQSLSREADCQTPVDRFAGTYQYMADAAIFNDCQSGKSYPVAIAAAQPVMERAYAATQVNPPDPAYCEIEGFLMDGPTPDENGTQTYLHIVRLIGFAAGGCE